jgi:hypothetical protein
MLGGHVEQGVPFAVPAVCRPRRADQLEAVEQHPGLHHWPGTQGLAVEIERSNATNVTGTWDAAHRA